MTNIDQRGINNQQFEFVSAREAARILDVKPATLYAYVSRGLLRSVPGASGRPRQYVRADIERLKARSGARRGHGAVAAGALRWGEPVLDSAITEITPLGPRYRGHSADELAGAGVTFEAVCELLWTGSLGQGAPWPEEPDMESVRRVRDAVPADAPPLAVLTTLLGVVAARDSGRISVTGDAALSRARALIGTMCVALAEGEGREACARPGLSVAERLVLALRRRAGSRARAEARAAIDQALIVMADHELNVSTFAVRVVASAEADMYACLVAGLAALSGPQHGGVCDRVEALLDECRSPERVSQVIRGRARRGEEIPGFGHPFYPGGDPRAKRLMDAALRLGVNDRRVMTAQAVIGAMARAESLPPTVDIALVMLSDALKLRAGAGASLFALGRVAGWLAHAMEQREAGFLVRPRARYVGPSEAR